MKIVFKYKKDCYKEDGDPLSFVSTGDRTSNGFKLQQQNIKFVLRKSFLTRGMIKQWDNSPRKVMEPPPLDSFKFMLDRCVRWFALGLDALLRSHPAHWFEIT